MSRVTKAYIAVIFLSIAWGTTYLAIRIGVMHYPAFLFAGIRQVVSAVLMAAIGLLMYKKADLSWPTMKQNIITGFLLIAIGNGIVSYAQKFIPSGVAALICSMMPLNAVLLNIFLAKHEKINAVIVSGLALAMVGVALIFRDNLADLANPAYFWGIIAIYIGTISWAYGSIRNSKAKSVKNPVFNAAMQLLVGGIFLLGFSPLIDSYDNFEPFQPDAMWAMVYLVIIGSLIAYTAYMYALKVLPVGVVTLYAYVNPLVAVILGYFILGEKLTWFTGLSLVAIVSGVYIVNAGYKKQKAKDIELKEAALLEQNKVAMAAAETSFINRKETV